jgi:PmbA protein
MKIDLNVAEDMIKKAKVLGADLVEVYMVSQSSLSVDIKDQDVEALESATESGYSVRVIKGDRMGFSYSTEINNWKEVVENAVEASRFTEEDPYLDIAEQEPLPKVNIFDPAVSTVKEEDAIGMAMLIEKEAMGVDKRIRRIRKASAEFSTHELVIVNSKGLRQSFKGTHVSAEVSLAAEEGSEAQMGWGFSSSRRLSDIDFGEVGREAAERALRLLGATRTFTTRGEVLLENSVVAEMLSVLAPTLSSENVQKGKSLLVNKIDQKVFSDKMNLIDSGLLDWKTGSRPFDAEGVPSRKNVLVQEGILRGYLYNLYTGKKEKVSSTSNAIRGGIHTPPMVGISNLFIEPSSKEYIKGYNELIRQIKKGMIVTEAMGVHTANPITGEFSIGATGLWVEDGEIKHPVKEAAISGTILELLSRVVFYSDRLRFYGKIGAPDILFEGIDISG